MPNHQDRRHLRSPLPPDYQFPVVKPKNDVDTEKCQRCGQRCGHTPSPLCHDIDIELCPMFR